jgi:hypothetical protein
MKRGVIGGGPSALTGTGPAAVRHGNAASAADTADSEARVAGAAHRPALRRAPPHARRAAGAAAGRQRLVHVIMSIAPACARVQADALPRMHALPRGASIAAHEVSNSCAARVRDA